jgi:hypothetical protein
MMQPSIFTRTCDCDDCKMNVMLSRKPSLILLNAASFTTAYKGTGDDAFWTLYNLALSFSNGGVL